MKNLSVENVYTRAHAKDLTKKHFWKLLGMTAVAFGIPVAMMTAVTTLTTSLAATQPVLHRLVTLVLSLAVSLGTCGLGLGLVKAMIDLARGDEHLTVGMVFQRMGYTLKAFGLSLWVGLKTFLWMLPGYLVMISSVFVVVGTVDPTTGAIPESAAGTMALLMFGGMLLMFILGIPAAYRYLMSTYILADNPETGVFQSVRESKAMMKGHKWQCFKLIVPVFLVMLVVMLVVSIALTAAAALLGTTAAGTSVMSTVMMVVMFALELYYMVRMYLCYAIFYIKRVEEQKPEEDAASAE